MSKQIITKYAFDASAKTVTFSEFESIDLGRLLLITNATDNIILYNFAEPAKGGTVTGNVLTLDYDTTNMDDSDKLMIHYEVKPTDPQYDRQIVGNARTKFRDGFASDDVAQPNAAVWDLVNDGTNHIVNSGGNSSGSSYLRISLSPFVDSSGVTLTSKGTFKFPTRLGFGVSMSQRIVGQEVFAGLVGVDDTGAIETVTNTADKSFTGATISITSNVGTITINNHGFAGGDRVLLIGCAEHRLNVGPVVVTVIDKNNFTVPITLTNGTYSTTGGIVRHADPFRNAKNGIGYLWENTTATNASFVTRRNGDKYRSANNTVASTTAAQTNTSPYTDSFNATAVNELYASLDEMSYRSYAADSNSSMSGGNKYHQGIPDEEKEYKLQIRARNLGGMTMPIARITSIVKSGTTTATVTTDVAHGLVANDYVQIYGVRDQTNFPNLTSSTVVATAPTSTTFTIVIGATTTGTSLAGTVFKNEGSVLAPGVFAQVVQSISRTNNVLTLVGSGTWATPLPGEYVQVHGLEPAASAYEGAYKVLRVNTTSLELESTGADFGSITTGGTVIKRTDVRLHFVRVMDYTRLAVEVTGGRGTNSDANNAVPVSITSSPTINVAQSTGVNSTMWAAGGWGGFLVNDIVSAAITSTATSSAVTPGSVANLGTNAHSFSVVVTAVSGTTPTMDVSVEESPDNGTNWVRMYDFPRITATGTYVSPIIPAAWGTRYRYVRTIAGTTPSFTMALNRMQHSVSVPLIRQFIDRSIVLTTLNSTTPAYFVDRAKVIQVALTLLAATTPPVLTIEGSEDNVNWYGLPNATLTGVASSTEVLYIVNVAPKYVRARVSTIGATITAGWQLNIKALED